MAGEAETDLEAIAVPSEVKLAGGVTIGAGLAAGITGLQALLFFRLPGALQVIGPVALLLAGGCVMAGWGVVRGRSRAALASVSLAGLTFLLGLAWVIFALLNGVLSLTALAVFPLSGAAVVLVALSLKRVQRIEAARERLRAQGLDAGF
ncbi:MAG TPA: hypothetical protein VGK73_19825 [Polyangiaceae bacterium]